jgi:MoaA/NifB/PqqE/SkfB family radical SAM enzyme
MTKEKTFNEYFPWSQENRNKAIKGYSNGGIPQVYLELGRACTLRCLYCDSPERGKVNNALSINEIKRLLDNLKELGLQFLFICGHGEPLNDPRFLPVIRYALDINLDVSFFSNLQPAYNNEQVLNELVELKPNILVKCDSLDRKIFDSILGIPDSSERTLSTITKLLKLGFLNIKNGTTNLALSIVTTSLNIDKITEVVSFAKEIGAYPCMGELETTGLNESSQRNLEVNRERLDELQKELNSKFGIIYERELCQGIFSGIHFKENGDIVVDMNTGLSCDWFLPKTNHQVIGNIRIDSIKTIWDFIIKLRLKKMDETIMLLNKLPTTIGLGGGSIPSKWSGIYRESTFSIDGKLEFNYPLDT